MRSLANNAALRIILVVLVAVTQGWGTTVSVAVTQAGIVVGTDRKFTNRDAATYRNLGNSGEHKKLLVVQHRIVVANIGTSNAVFRGVERYDFLTWMKNLQTNIPANVTVDGLAEIIRTESAKELAFVPDMIASRDLQPQTPDEFFRMFAQYLIVGYDFGKPKFYLVEFDLDWDRNILIGPKLVSFDPDSQPGNFHIYFFGFKEALTDLSNRNSYAYQQTMLRCPQAFSDLVFNRRVVTPDETATIVTAFINIEKRLNPSDVGGDVEIATITPEGRAVEQVKPTSLAKTVSSKPKPQGKR